MQALAPSQRAGLAGHFRIDVDSVSGLPPVITYLQGERIPSGTVASYMGIEQLLAHHFLVHGQWRCPHCGGRCVSYRAEEVEGAVLEQIGEGQITVLAPLRETAVGMGESLWGELRRAGYVRVRIDGEIHRLDGDTGTLNTDQVEVVVDRLRPGGGDSRRFIEAVRSARAIGKGSSLILDADDRLWPMNQSLTCQTCALVLDTPSQEMLLESDSRAQDLYVSECSWSSVGASSVQVVDALLALTEEKTVRSVLATLNRLGLDHLPLGQPLSTLSHSEWQRLRLAFCLSSGMAGILYAFEGIISCVEGVLRQSVAACLQRLVEGGNTVLLVDAAPEAQRIARSVWEFSEGRCVERVDGVESATTEIDFPIGEGARWQVQGEGEWGRVDLDLPQGAIIGIVGEASCGKTRFMREVLESTLRERSASYRAYLALRKPRVHVPVGALGGKTVFEELGIHGAVAELFAKSPMGVELGYPSEFYRTDKPGGRCPACSGRGYTQIDLDFFEDAESPCAVCGGTRFRSEVLQVTYRGVHVGKVLEMDLGRARHVFAREKKIADRLRWTAQAGLDYLLLGTDVGQLEWGECLRLQLAVSIKGKPSERDFVVLDHLTPGIHPTEVGEIVSLLRYIAREGGTVLVADAHPHLLSACASLVRIGPENDRRAALVV